MQDEPTSPGAEAPKSEPTVAGAWQEAKEAFAAAGGVVDVNVKKAVKKVKKAVKKVVAKARPATKKKVAKAKKAGKPAEKKAVKKVSPAPKKAAKEEGPEGRAKGQEAARSAGRVRPVGARAPPLVLFWTLAAPLLGAPREDRGLDGGRPRAPSRAGPRAGRRAPPRRDEGVGVHVRRRRSGGTPCARSPACGGTST